MSECQAGTVKYYVFLENDLFPSFYKATYKTYEILDVLYVIPMFNPKTSTIIAS